ncbi:MAG: amidohydrolase [Candidatus Heimdallarchaeota archaeon]|nr:amidohydrolase [Candidatus Heimdallarchaeota archaeon]
MKKAFVHATIHPVVGEVINDGTLLVEDSKIIAVGRDVSTDGYEIEDCTGLHITPGLIDPHSHVGLFEEGAGPGPAYSDGNELTDASVPYLRTKDAIFPEDLAFEDARMGGVTTMALTHGSANPIGAQFCVVKSYGSIVDDMVIKETAGVKMALGENPKRVGLMQKRAPQTRMGVAYIVRKEFYDALDYRNDWLEYEHKVKLEEIKPEEERGFVKPPKKDLGKEILLEMIDKKQPGRIHAHRADDIITAIRLAEEFGFNYSIEHATEAIKVKDIIVEKQVPIIVGPLLTSRSKRELVSRTMETPGIMAKAGAFMALTQDAPVIPIQGLRDSLIQAIREGLPEENALMYITINPAKMIGLQDKIGSLEKGKDADFLIFNGDPLDARKFVMKTYIDGNLVFNRLK